MTGEPGAPFARRTTIVLVALGALSLATVIAGIVLGPDLAEPADAGASAASRSALGHRALVDVLRELDVPVLVSHFDSARKAGASAVLVIAEPRVDTADGDPGEKRAGDLRDVLAGGARNVLLVLPKRGGVPRRTRPAWLSTDYLLPDDEVTAVLHAVVRDAELARVEAAATWDRGDFPFDPTLDQPQLVRSDSLSPLIASAGGVLLGEVAPPEGADEDMRLWILSDPDLLATHGLGRGDNAALVVEILERLRAGGAVVFDETLRGPGVEPTLWRELFRFPLVPATLAALLALLVLLLAATGRFGAPLPPPPATERGKRFLVENTAALVRLGGHAAHALDRYLHATMQEVVRASHAPAHVGAAEVRAWLMQIERTRGVSPGLAELERAVEAAARAQRGREQRVLACACGVHAWHRGMVGARSRDGDGRPPRGPKHDRTRGDQHGR